MRIAYENQPSDFREARAAFPRWQRWLWSVEPWGYFALASIPPACLTAAFENRWGLAAGLVLTAGWAVYQVCGKGRNDQGTTRLLRQMTVVLDREFLRVEIEHGWTERDWSLVREIRETKKHLLVFVSPVHCYPIPRAAFSSPAQLAAFRQQLGQRVAAHRRGPPPPSPPPPPQSPAAEGVPGSETREVAFQSKPRDILNAYQRAAVPTRWRANPRGSIVAAILVAAFSLVLLSACRPQAGLLWALSGLLAFLALFLLSLLALEPLWRIRQAKFLDPIDLQPQRLTLAPDGMHIEGAGHRRFASWRMISRVEADPRAVVFYDLRPLSYCVIPRTAFASWEAARGFTRLAAAYHAALTTVPPHQLPADHPGDTENPYQPPAAM
ncbi:MAG: hypothetical protein GTO03_18415 [Planctomycetales bacterium]|nr:hypothetical protein [Planctomycetales bacterium]